MSTALPTDDAREFPWIGMLALAAGSFSIVTVEILPTGLLPEISREFGASEALVGMLVSLFAFAVVLFSAPLTQLTRRFPRKALVLGSLLVATLAGFAACVAPSFPVLAVVRVVGGMAHGLYWSIVGAYPSYLVGSALLGRAVAVNSAGTSLATVLGLPLGTWIGQAIGWRLAFAAIASIGVVALAFAAKSLPAVRGAHESAASGQDTGTGSGTEREEASELIAPITASVPVVTTPIPVVHPAGKPDGEGAAPVVLICLVTAIYMGGAFAFSTYVAPLMRDVVGLPESALSGILLVQGLVGFVSALVTGWVFARRPRRWLIAGMVGQTALVFAFWLVAEGRPGLALAAFWAMAFVAGAVPMLLQVLLLRVAPARIRDVSASFYTASFNLGIGAGAALGALIVQWWGVRNVALANTALALVALALILGYARWRARRARVGGAAPEIG